MKLPRLLLPLAFLAVPAAAQDRAPTSLVIAIEIDGLSADLLDRYRPHFSGGLARLSQGIGMGAGHRGQATIGDLMAHADPRARIVAVAGDKMTGGLGPNERWWWSGRGFVGHEGRAAPRSVGLVNTNVGQALARPRPPLELPDICRARSSAGPGGGGRFARAAGDARAFRSSPELDGATLALAAGLRAELALGEGEASDLLIVSLPASGHVDAAHGAQGLEMCLQLLSLDRSLGDFLRLLDSSGVDYAAVLTAGEGASTAVDP